MAIRVHEGILVAVFAVPDLFAIVESERILCGATSIRLSGNVEDGALGGVGPSVLLKRVLAVLEASDPVSGVVDDAAGPVQVKAGDSVAADCGLMLVTSVCMKEIMALVPSTKMWFSHLPSCQSARFSSSAGAELEMVGAARAPVARSAEAKKLLANMVNESKVGN